MNCEVQADQSATPTPRADAARPVLHFTGRADMEASMDALAVEWWRLPAWQARQDYERPTTDTMIRIHAISRALEPPRDR